MEMESYVLLQQFMMEDEKKEALDVIKEKRARLNSLKEANDLQTKMDNQFVAEIKSRAAGIKKEGGLGSCGSVTNSAKKKSPILVHSSVFANTSLGKKPSATSTITPAKKT